MVATFFIYEGVQFFLIELSEYNYNKRFEREKLKRYEELFSQPWWDGDYVPLFRDGKASSDGGFRRAGIVTVVIIFGMELVLIFSI